MSSVEVKVTRTVPDSVWTEALKALYEDLIRRAHAYADSYSPVDRNALSRSLAPQVAGEVDGGAWPQWATYGPKVTDPPYAGYLNAGSYVRTWVPPYVGEKGGGIKRWGKLKGMTEAESKGIHGGMFQRRGVTVHYHYVQKPQAKPPATTSDQYGLRTKGWFNPSVPQALEKGGDLQDAADEFAKRIERAWNKK